LRQSIQWFQSQPDWLDQSLCLLEIAPLALSLPFNRELSQFLIYDITQSLGASLL
jgi:hypothetical protein